MKSDRRENVRWTLMNRRWDIVLEIRLVSGVILRNGLQNVLSITRSIIGQFVFLTIYIYFPS